MRVIRAVLISGLLALAVVGCGSSSSSSTGTQANGGNNRQQVAACLKKQGITLPQGRPANRPPGGGSGGGGGFFFGGGGGQPRNFSKVRAALRKCGINPQRRGTFTANNPQLKQALSKFVACVRKNGYDLPDPNTSGKGPVFDTSKVDTGDPKFKAATKKCQGDLRALRPQGAPGQPPLASG